MVRSPWLALAVIAACGRIEFGAQPDAGAPPGTFLLVASGDGTVQAYAADPATWSLAPTAQGPIQVGSPQLLGVTPDGRFAFTPDYADDRVFGFALDPHTGELSPIPGTPITEPDINLQAAIVHPSGKYLYVVDGKGAKLIAHSIDTATGALTPLATLSTATAGAYAPAFDPSGQLLYVSTYATTVVGVAIDAANGVPSALAGSPFPAQSSNMIPTFDRTGSYLYLCANSTSLRGFKVDPSGALSDVPGSPYANPQAFFWLSPDPTNHFLVGTTGQASGVFVWTIDASTGALTKVAGSPFAADPAERSLQWGAFTPDGRYLYVGSDYLTAMQGRYELSLLAFDPTTGAVSVAASAIVPRTAYVNSMVLVTPH